MLRESNPNLSSNRRDSIYNLANKTSLASALFLLIAGGWALYFVVAPTIGFDLLDSWHNEQRMLQVTLVLASALTFAVISIADRPFCFLAPDRGMWIFIGLGVLSACFATMPFHAFAELALTVELILLGALAATAFATTPKLSGLTLLSLAWLIGAIYVVGVAANYVGATLLKQPIDPVVFILGYANPRFVSASHALIIPLLSWLLFSPRKSICYSSGIIASLLWAINIALGTRAIWAVFSVTGALFWCFGGSEGRRAVKVLSITGVLGCLLYVLVSLAWPSMLPQTGAITSRLAAMAGDSGRLDLWKAAADQILLHPFLGVGPMQLSALKGLPGAHPHNWLLQVAAEWGLLAAAVLVATVLVWLGRVRQSLNAQVSQPTKGIFPAIALSGVTSIAYGLVDGNWVMPVSQSLAAIIIGASCGLMHTQRVTEGNRARIVQVSASVLLALVASLTIANYVARTLPEQKQNEEDWVRKTRVQYFYPRFWQQGVLAEPQPS